ncbi:MAG: dehydrogenase E1 component subunit alpha/beta [Saprospiraceae bacterium]|nr:dehydrogenase E1 component subunit alpha/beta [Saprospiraceae bacterium]
MKEATYSINYKIKKSSTPDIRKALYTGMLYPRMIEEKMLKLLRQGKISKWFSGIGQEAISVGTTMALKQDDLIFPLHRNLGVFTSRLVPLKRMISQWQGKPSGFTKGRDRSFHFGSLEHHIVGMISHLGPQLSLAAGAALGYKLDGSQNIALTFTGEGGTSEGEFHEALNLAAVWKLPVIFVIENNGYALSTPTSQQYICESLSSKGVGYGMKAYQIDGNDVLEVYNTTQRIIKKIKKKPQPILLECRTFRMRGHEEASGTKYVPDELMDEWGAKDPLINYESFLLELGEIDQDFIDQTRLHLQHHIDDAVKAAFSEDEVNSDHTTELQAVYVASGSSDSPTEVGTDYRGERKIRFIDSIREALWQAMVADPKLILMGQDIGEYGGVFKATEGLISEFGAERVRNTPLCESAVIGAGVGLSLAGYRSMVEMQFSDFVTCGFNQIVNNLAKLHYRWAHAPKVLIRMPTGGNVGAGPFHSQSTESWFVHVPGLKILYPSNAYDAKGLLMAGLQEPNPVMFFEHKFLYRSSEDLVPEEPYTIPIGKARVVRPGRLVSIITYGLGVSWATSAADDLDIDAEIVDLRTLCPLDFETIDETIKKTGRVLILHEATLTGGVGGELAAYIAEHLFEYLDAPVVRCASLDTPVPFAKSLETLFLPVERFKLKLADIVRY